MSFLIPCNTWRSVEAFGDSAIALLRIVPKVEKGCRRCFESVTTLEYFILFQTVPAHLDWFSG